MIEEKNIFEVTAQQLTIVLTQLDSKYDITSSSPYNFK